MGKESVASGGRNMGFWDRRFLIYFLGFWLISVTGIYAAPIDGEWLLVTHQLEVSGQKTAETRIGWEPKDASIRLRLMKEGVRVDNRFGGIAVIRDRLSVITFHWGLDVQVYVFEHRFGIGDSAAVFVMGTGWEPGQVFQTAVQLQLNIAPGGFVLTDRTPEEIEFDRRQGVRYDVLRLDLKTGDRIERFLFRRYARDDIDETESHTKPEETDSKSGRITPPQLISSVSPTYPKKALKNGIEGTVFVEFIVDGEGKVAGARAVSGPSVLQQAAIESLLKWRFTPAVRDGKPLPVRMTQPVRFRLSKK